MNYLFHAEFARNYLFKKKLQPPPPPPWRLNGGPLTVKQEFYFMPNSLSFKMQQNSTKFSAMLGEDEKN